MDGGRPSNTADTFLQPSLCYVVVLFLRCFCFAFVLFARRVLSVLCRWASPSLGLVRRVDVAFVTSYYSGVSLLLLLCRARKRRRNLEAKRERGKARRGVVSWENNKNEAL